jgi:hypothetical protein
MKNKKILKLDMNLPVLIKKEGSAYVAYTPALDISTYGMTKGQAKKSFEELVTVFFDEFIENPDGLDIVLTSLGWTKRKNNWQPPKIENITQDVRVSLAV